MQTISSSASVTTDRPARYAKQLVSHLSRRLTGTWSDETGAGELQLGESAAGALTAAPGALLLRIDSPVAELDRWEDVVGRHLVRFGARDELVVSWQRSDGSAGQEFRNDAADAAPTS